ncbi:uncharacterized protein LOC118437126 [Folsomia candida]|uniref:uncharacterized protein LOC118437126 n=1 Tax=Folsomia candida TaxID=158441 RepID=UPI0016055BEA|nr:uncharacterized protein LOC118437126 [Folsomia candida]
MGNFEAGSFALDPRLLTKLGEEEDKFVTILRDMVASCSGNSCADDGSCYDLVLRYLDLCPVGDIVEGNKDNPFYAFKLLFRMGNVLTEVNTKCTEGKGTFAVELAALINKLEVALGTAMPSLRDVEIAAEGMLKLQETYQTSTAEFCNGKIAHHDFNETLSFLEILALGNFARNLDMVDVDITYLIQAKEVASSKKRKSMMAYLLKQAITEHNTYWSERKEATDLERYGLFTTPIIPEEPLPVQTGTMLRQLKKTGEIPPTGELSMLNLCAGNNYQNEAEKATLKCWYETESNHYFRIAPLKVELMSSNARVNLRLIHNVIGSNDIEKLLTFTNDDMKQAAIVVDTVSDKPVVGMHRRSLQRRVNMGQTEFLAPVFKNIEMLSGIGFLARGMSEDLQISEYSYVGSSINIHVDPKTTNFTNDVQKWERAVTCMIYVSETCLKG